MTARNVMYSTSFAAPCLSHDSSRHDGRVGMMGRERNEHMGGWVGGSHTTVIPDGDHSFWFFFFSLLFFANNNKGKKSWIKTALKSTFGIKLMDFHLN